MSLNKSPACRSDRAAKMTASAPEQRYLTLRTAHLHQPAPPADPAS